MTPINEQSRLRCNLELIELLKKLVNENPELRFGQILAGWDFVISKTDFENYYWADEFMVESYSILNRVEAKIKD